MTWMEFRGEIGVSVMNVRVVGKWVGNEALGAQLSHREMTEGQKGGQH